MAANLTNLLLSIGHALAQASGGAATLGANLFVHQRPAAAVDPSSVLRIYGGPTEMELRPVPAVSVQCMTLAMDAGAGLQLARTIFEALHDSSNSGRPRQSWSVVGKMIDATTGAVVDDTGVTWDVRLIVLTSGGPGIVGRDDSGRSEISFNFDVRFTHP